MARIIRKSVDTSIESNILTASIISTHFIEEIYPLYNPQYFTNSFAKQVMNWVLDYFDQFGEAPKQHIQDIFTVEKQILEDAEIEIIQTFLENLSARYVDNQGINDEYILDQAIQYFRKREVEVRVGNAQALLQIGKLDKAEEELTKMKKVMKLTSNWVNPFESESINHVFDERHGGILTFPGELGKLLGPLERGWFIAWLAPFKRGKSFLLQEAVVIAAISGLKAVFISLEMQPKALNERIYKRITAYGEAEKQHLIPVFDCLNNQLGKCSFPECKGSNDALAEDKEHIPEYSPELNHRVCTRCKNIHQGQYELATWFEPVDKPEFSRKNVDKKLKSFTKMYGDNIRIKCYPKFSAGVSDIKRDLDILEQTEGFIPDVIAVDYVGILKVENGGKDHKGLDDSWKSLAALFAERRVVGFSASQGTRGGLHKDTLSSEDIAEWIGSLGHVDIFGAINQTKQEKLRGIIRLGLFAHRHQEFSEDTQITVLQALSLGQVHLDSYQ